MSEHRDMVCYGLAFLSLLSGVGTLLRWGEGGCND